MIRRRMQTVGEWVYPATINAYLHVSHSSFSRSLGANAFAYPTYTPEVEHIWGMHRQVEPQGPALETVRR